MDEEERPCPCCTQDEDGDFWDLCEPCMIAALIGPLCKHCKRKLAVETDA